MKQNGSFRSKDTFWKIDLREVKIWNRKGAYRRVFSGVRMIALTQHLRNLQPRCLNIQRRSPRRRGPASNERDVVPSHYYTRSGVYQYLTSRRCLAAQAEKKAQHQHQQVGKTTAQEAQKQSRVNSEACLLAVRVSAASWSRARDWKVKNSAPKHQSASVVCRDLAVIGRPPLKSSTWLIFFARALVVSLSWN